ncbi:uncharacterized protein [Clytia hemisphaerica]|uniref:uncharacterized protein n=1 Tax=Clytia hemisphaerica TaxID=252671 RepID=UPI0034D7AB31
MFAFLIEIWSFLIALLSTETLAQMQLVNLKPQTTGTRFLKGIKNFKLADKDLFTLHGLKRIEECMFESINTKGSGSINYHREQNICMVNKYTTVNETEASLERANGWVFYEKERPNEKGELKNFFYIRKGQGIGNILDHSNDWCFSFELFMRKAPQEVEEEKQILHLMTKQGKSNPEISFRNNNIQVFFTDSGQQFVHPTKIQTKRPTNISICRIHSERRTDDRAFLTIDEETVQSAIPFTKAVLEDVKILTSDPWKKPLSDAIVKDLYYQQKVIRANGATWPNIPYQSVDWQVDLEFVVFEMPSSGFDAVFEIVNDEIRGFTPRPLVGNPGIWLNRHGYFTLFAYNIHPGGHQIHATNGNSRKLCSTYTEKVEEGKLLKLKFIRRGNKSFFHVNDHFCEFTGGASKEFHDLRVITAYIDQATQYPGDVWIKKFEFKNL